MADLADEDSATGHHLFVTAWKCTYVAGFGEERPIGVVFGIKSSHSQAFYTASLGIGPLKSPVSAENRDQRGKNSRTSGGRGILGPKIPWQ